MFNFNALPGDLDKEFAGWKNLLDGTTGNWREDQRYRNKKDGALYYLGDESGCYMKMSRDGKLTVGRYELARPGIEDAVLFSRATVQYKNYEHAYIMASQLAGQRFMADIFQDKPSVVEKLREARKNPAPPSPKKDLDKGDADLER